MALKIWYQSMGRTDSWVGYGAHLRAQIARAASGGTTIEVHGTRNGIGAQYLYLEHLAVDELVGNLHRAMAEGFDAFLIGNFYDPAISMCREISSIPVLGLGETSLHVACMMGRRVSVVLPNVKGALRMQERVREIGLGERVAGIVSLATDRILDLNDAYADDTALQAFVEAMETVTASHAANAGDVVIPGGGVLMGLCDRAGLHRTRRGAPVLDGITTLVKMGETAASLNRMSGGAFVSKAGYFASPSPSMLPEIRAVYGEHVYPGPSGGTAPERSGKA